MSPMIVTTPQILANTVKAYRHFQKQSQSDVAKFANVKQATISQFENDPTGTKLETLFNILTALELELVVQPRPKNNQAKFDDEGEIW